MAPALLVTVPVSVITVIMFRLSGSGEFMDIILNNPERLQALPEEVFWELARPFYIAIGVASVLQIVSGVFVALASHRTVASELNGTSITGSQAARHALRRFGAGLGATVMILVVVAILAGLGAAIWLVPVLAVGTPNGATRLVALLLFGALLGPGIWAGVAMSMTTSAVAIEDIGAIGSIRRSMRLVRGRWWPTAGFLMLVGLLGGIAIQLIQLIALPLAALGGTSGMVTIASGLGVFAQGLLLAGIAAMYTHWYIDLRARKESLSTDDLS